jgi:hypothetical protein
MKRTQMVGVLATAALLIAALSFSQDIKVAQKTHLDWAKILVRELQPANTSYQHKHGYVNWKGNDGKGVYESHTDCSGFLTALLEQAYGFNKDYFMKWLNTGRPLATTYHDAILNQQGFRQIQYLVDVQPGDVIAIKYPPGSENTGHILLVAERPRQRKASQPEIEGTDQWEVTVIDSSQSGHGKTDTRRRDDGAFGAGVGQGICRLYANRKSQITGYTWSTLAKSEYYDQRERHLVIGRLNL